MPPGALRASGDGLAWVGGLVLTLSSFMSWYTISPDGFTASIIGWNTGPIGKLVFFIGVAVLALLILHASGVDLPPSVPHGMVDRRPRRCWRRPRPRPPHRHPRGLQPTVGRSIGIWISLLAALLLIVAGLLKLGRRSLRSATPARPTAAPSNAPARTSEG